MTDSPFPSDPISRIEWRKAEELFANSYNPNAVMNAELTLLERSILINGWIQPILINRDGMVIDGFHRWMLSKESKAITARYQGMCPCVVMDIPVEEAMMLTVRINRAKGSHIAIRMHELVTSLINDHHLSPEEVARGIGASKAEIDLLYQENIFLARDMKNYQYSQAWIPKEDGQKVRPVKGE